MKLRSYAVSDMLLVFLFSLVCSSTFSREVMLDSCLNLGGQSRAGKLSNGLSYYIRRVECDNSSVFIKLVVKAGFADEDVDQFHFAHVLEHAAFGRSRNFENIKISLIDHGFDPGIDFGAGTRDGSTYYWISSRADRSEDLEFSLRVAREWSDGLILDSTSVKLATTTVISEIGGPSFSPLGSLNAQSSKVNSGPNDDIIRSLTTVTVDKVRRFYSDWYRPDLLGVIVVGKVDVMYMESLIGQIFAQMENPKNRREKKVSIRTQESRGNWDIYSKTRKRLTIKEFYGRRSFDFGIDSDIDEYAAIMATSKLVGARIRAIGAFPIEHLVAMSVDFQQSTSGIEAGVDGVSCVMQIEGGLGRRRFSEVFRKGSQLEDALFTSQFSEREADEAKREVKVDFLKRIAENRFYIDLLEKHFLGLSSSSDIDHIIIAFGNALDGLSVDDLLKQGTAIRTRSPDILIVPDASFKDKPVSEQRIRSIMKEAKRRKVSYDIFLSKSPPIMPDSLASVFINQDVTVGEKKCVGINVTKIRLENGISIIFRPIKSGGKKIIVRGIKRAGANIFSGDDYYKAFVAGSAIFSAGLGDLDNVQLERFMRKHGMSVAPYVTKDETGIEVEGMSNEYEPIFQLLNRMLSSPRLDPRSFNAYRRQYKPVTPLMTLYDSIRSIYGDKSEFEGHVNILRRGDFQIVLDIYKRLFCDPNGFTFIITGDFDLDTIKMVAVKYLAGLRNVSPLPVPIDFYSSMSKGDRTGTQAFQIRKVYRNGTESMSFYFIGKSTFDPTAVAEMEILRRVLQDVLLRRLRIQMGGIYNVAVSVGRISSNNYQFTIDFNTSFGDGGGLISAVWSEIESIKSISRSETELAALLIAETGRLERIQQTHDYWQRFFYNQIVSRRSVCELSESLSILKQFKGLDIPKIAEKYLGAERKFEFVRKAI